MNRLFGKMTIRQKLQLGFGALILLVMSLAGITVRNNLVARVTQNDGYNFFSLTRASAVVNCQSALA
jgi:hypothetical protein